MEAWFQRFHKEIIFETRRDIIFCYLMIDKVTGFHIVLRIFLSKNLEVGANFMVEVLNSILSTLLPSCYEKFLDRSTMEKTKQAEKKYKMYKLRKKQTPENLKLEPSYVLKQIRGSLKRKEIKRMVLSQEGPT